MSDVAKASAVTRFRLGSTALEKWMRQNQAEYTGDYVEGCLLDNFVLACKRGFAAVYEHALTCWTSDYIVEFAPGAAQDVWENWYRFADSTAKT
jgi:hypothetical protein